MCVIEMAVAAPPAAETPAAGTVPDANLPVIESCKSGDALGSPDWGVGSPAPPELLIIRSTSGRLTWLWCHVWSNYMPDLDLSYAKSRCLPKQT